MVATPSVRDAYDAQIQSLRHTEFPSLLDTTYLDHAGTTLYASTLIDSFHKDLKDNLFGNPHSESPASNLSTQRIESARLEVLKYFNADPEHFDIVFTANATAAVKLVSDCLRDRSFWYGFHKDAHNSLVGVREVAELGSRCFASDEEVESWIKANHKSSSSGELGLFAYPAQSNMTGYRPPLSWAKRIRSSTSGRMLVMLDAASYLTTGRLNLQQYEDAPDFIALSFYKIFGFPDLGGLIIKKTASDILRLRSYFAGGTVDMVTTIDDSFHIKKGGNIHDFLEDGTLPFHNIVALSHAIRIQETLFHSAQAISDHVTYLSYWLYQRLSVLKHYNNAPVLQLHKDPAATYGDPITQGPIFSFSIRRSDGTFVDKSHFERIAIDCGFQIRTGGVCNPGGIATMLNLTSWELRRNYVEGARCGGDIDVVGGKPTGIIRISLGSMSTMTDIKRFVAFVEWFCVESRPSEPCICHGDVVSENHKLLTRSIYPVEFCSPMLLTQEEDPAAYSVWNTQWCIVEWQSEFWKLGTLHRSYPQLTCSIDPASGFLRLCCKGQPDLRVCLWERPPRNEVQTDTSSQSKAFDVYQESAIEEWLSQALGTKCTLARYRGQGIENLSSSRSCALAMCDVMFNTRTELFQHYKVHAAGFLLEHGLGGLKRHSDRSPAHVRLSRGVGKRSWINSWSSTLISSEKAETLSSSLYSTKIGEENTSGWKQIKAKLLHTFLNCGSSCA